VHGLLSLAKVATKFGIAPPEIVKIEMELDELKKVQPSNDVKVIPPTAEELAADQIKQKVDEVCKEFMLPQPERLQSGLYKFNEQTTAYVRILRGVPLVRWKDNWEEFASFILQLKLDESKAAKADDQKKTEDQKRIEEEQKRQEEEQRKLEQQRQLELQQEQEQQLKQQLAQIQQLQEQQQQSEQQRKIIEQDKIRLEQSLDKLRLDEETKKEDEERVRQEQADVTAKMEFFYLTALAVKMNHELREDAAVIDTAELYQKAIELDVPFNLFAEWIEKELTKSYLKLNHQERMLAGNLTQEDLRERRRKTVSSLQKRKGESPHHASHMHGQYP